MLVHLIEVVTFNPSNPSFHPVMLVKTLDGFLDDDQMPQQSSSDVPSNRIS